MPLSFQEWLQCALPMAPTSVHTGPCDLDLSSANHVLQTQILPSAAWAGGVVDLYDSHGSMSVTAAQLLKAREQIIANLAFNTADNCFLVLFNKLCFFHMKMNRVKTLPVLWGSDFRVLRWDINWTTGLFEACLHYFLPWISKWMC